MRLSRLSKDDRDVIRRALRAIHDGPFLDEADFRTRVGVDRERLTKMLANWPIVDDSDSGSDEALLISNALNEIAHGLSLSDDEWTRWFGSLPRERVRDVLDHWRGGEVALHFGPAGQFSGQPEVFVARVPAGITEKRELLLHLARELRLPDYFGVNWDALDECINDFDWIEAQSIVLVHADIPLGSDLRNASIYVSILNGAVRRWASSEEHNFTASFPTSARDRVEALIATNEQGELDREH